MVEAQIGSDEELQKEVSRLQQELADKSSSLDTASSELEALRKTCSVSILQLVKNVFVQKEARPMLLMTK